MIGRSSSPLDDVAASRTRIASEDSDTVETATPAGTETNDLLRALLGVTGRIAFPEDRLRKIVSPQANHAYLLAYRLCDGKTPMSSIAKQAGLDAGNLSKTIGKWVELGVAFRNGPKRLPLHLYAVPDEDSKPVMGKKVRSPKSLRAVESANRSAVVDKVPSDVPHAGEARMSVPDESAS